MYGKAKACRCQFIVLPGGRLYLSHLPVYPPWISYIFFPSKQIKKTKQQQKTKQKRPQNKKCEKEKEKISIWCGSGKII